MKVNPIRTFNNFIEKQNPKTLLKLSVALIAGSSMMKCSEEVKENYYVDKIQKEIKSTGISKKDYDKLDDSISIFTVESKPLAWQHALDSIKMFRSKEIYKNGNK